MGGLESAPPWFTKPHKRPPRSATATALFPCHSSPLPFHFAAMQRSTIWITLVVLLLGVVYLREPRLEQTEELFLRWLLKNSTPHGPQAPLTVVEIGHDAVLDRDPLQELSSPHPGGSGVSPLEFALFLQTVLEFQPPVVAF